MSVFYYHPERDINFGVSEALALRKQGYSIDDIIAYYQDAPWWVVYELIQKVKIREVARKLQERIE